MCVIIDLSPGLWLWTLKPLHGIEGSETWPKGVLCPTIDFLKCGASGNFNTAQKTFPLYFRIKSPRTGLDISLYHSPTLTFVLSVTAAVRKQK